jgi:hypothetical protein
LAENNDSILFFLDETGDHSLYKIDKYFPIFVLTAFIVNKEKYITEIIPAANKIKFDFFGHEGIIFHSRDIRKSKPPFDILQNKTRKEKFINAITDLMKNSDFKLLVSVIRKDKLITKYKTPYNPYNLALKFILERIIILLKDSDQINITIIAESRGKKEDDQLRLSFHSIINSGTERISKSVFDDFHFVLKFLPKTFNILGTQLADLSGYPIGRKVLFPEKDNFAFEVIKDKIFRKVHGWECFKVFP